MNLNIHQMIAGSPNRLRFVYRYSTTRVTHPENVAEHSYYVALYAMLVAKWFTVTHYAASDDPNEDPTPINMENLLQRALLHDLEEAVSGDFPRPFKRSSPELKQMLERASQKAFEQVIEPVCGPQTQIDETIEITEEMNENGPNVTDEYICSWLNSKDDSPEGRILEFADFLAVLSFMIQEGAASGNRSIVEHVSHMDEYFKTFQDESFDFIRPLIQQTEEIMMQTFPKQPMQIHT